jgi:multidrug resistance efflux pump
VWTVRERGKLFEQATENYLTDQFFYEQANKDRAQNEIEMAIANLRVTQAQLRVDALTGSSLVSENGLQRTRLEVAQLESELAALKRLAPSPNQSGDVLADYAQQLNDLERQLAEAKINVKQVEADLSVARQDQSIDARQAELDLMAAKVELEQLQEQEPNFNFAQVQSKAYLDRSTRDLEEARNKYYEVANTKTQPPELLALHQATMTYFQAKAANDLASISVNRHEVLLREHEVEQAEINLARLQNQQPGSFNIDREYALLNIKQLEAQLANTQLTASMDGTVLALNLQVGQVVKAFEPVGVVGDLNQLQVIGDRLSSQVQAELAEGMPAIVSRISDSPAQNGIPAQLIYLPDPPPVNFNFDEDSSAGLNYAPRLMLQAPNVNLQLGDRVRVSVITNRRKNVLWLPPQAIKNNGEYFVIVKNGDGGGRPVRIQVGQQTAQQVEIKSGLLEGQIVIGQ